MPERQPRYAQAPASRAPLASEVLLAGFAMLSAALLSDDARAQSSCGDSYVLRPGETLYQVTQQCRVGLADLIRANPSIDDIDNLQVGMQLAIPGNGSGDSPDRPDTYMIEPGDTLYSIAEQQGVELSVLLQANPDLDPHNLAIGTTINIPGDGDMATGEPTISVRPLAGAPGTPVTVTGANYTPGETVTIGAGPPQSEWTALETALVAPDGAVSALVAIPERTEPGREIVFVIDSQSAGTIVSSRVDVVAERDPDTPVGDQPGGDLELEGRITQGVECPVIETRDGRIYSLLAEEALPMGTYARVEGAIAEASFCMQGEATVDVRAVVEIAPTGSDPT